MSITALFSNEFDLSSGNAKQISNNDEGLIVDRSLPASVLFGIDDDRRLAGGQQKIADLLAISDDVEFEQPKLGDLVHPARFP